jgi:NAD(P)H-dependent FMN reductase
MAEQKLIVGISGTNRPDNYTSRALAVSIDEIRKVDRDARIEVVDGRQLQLGFPGSPPSADAHRMQALLREAAGVVLATPEYHVCPRYILESQVRDETATKPLVMPV